ncbi:hypothetical protein N7495_001464 [Penicillium taxi]|uniref:uncharacterized protein n=1 Tax=Penicillium taxi TaxID=168475 RepID=UPI002545A260|nr:uncharacterized protein N7495_001464 [Penicillium taxi]KAJ5908782.1 hypothetical protein N7495_001464 [Penicillium taxi]
MSDSQATPANGDGQSSEQNSKRPASEIDDSEQKDTVMAETAVEDSPNVIDEQVAQVLTLSQQPLKDGQKGFVISKVWLNRVFARSTTHSHLADKDSLSHELGPVDNTDVILDDPTNINLHDEHDQIFVPLRPDLQLGVDYEIIPQEGWDLIINWYGLVSPSSVIVRYAHETIQTGNHSNVLYELNPPVVSIYKLSNPSALLTPQALKEKSLPPARALAGRQTNFQKWLKKVKELAGIDMSTKVRVWKILGSRPSGTPSVSRATSPTKASSLLSSTHQTISVDVNTFLSLAETTDRELLQGVKDQTSNQNYNGRMTLIMAGLVETNAVVLEEQIGGPGGGEWTSEVSALALKRMGIPIDQKKDIVPSIKSTASSGKSSPVLNLPGGHKPSGNRLGVTGLNNLGNTCYQNAATQCLRAVEELSVYFLQNAHKADLNHTNVLGFNGNFASAYAHLLHNVYRSPSPTVNPRRFREQVGRCNPMMAGWDQQDSQEFLMFTLDSLSEDLNRIQKKPYIEKTDSTDDMVIHRKLLEEFAAKSWTDYKARNDSVIIDLFAGMYKSTLTCPECDKVSIMFDPFSNLTLPIPVEKRNVIYREIIYMPLSSAPKRFTVEVDKLAPISELKNWVASKRQVDPELLLCAELSDGAFWQIMDRETASLVDLNVDAKDSVVIVELDSPIVEDTVLIPIFHRRKAGGGKKSQMKRDVFALPFIITLSQAEAKDLESIYRKIFKHVATMTTRDILNETNDQIEDVQTPEGSDTVIMNAEDSDSDPRVKTDSVDGEDSLVNISVQQMSPSSNAGTEDTDATEVTDNTLPRSLASVFPAKLLNLFDVTVQEQAARMASYPAGSTRRRNLNSTIPHGRNFNAFEQYPLIASRLPTPKIDDSPEDCIDEHNGSDSDESEFGATAHQKSILSQGDSIVLEWKEEARHELFGGDKSKRPSSQGNSTWSTIEYIHDPEIIKLRAERDAKRDQGISLDQCLNEFRKDEILSKDDAWYCPRCKEHRQAKKQFEIWYAPDILVIHLKRFTQSGHGRGGRSKLSTVVDFPLNDLDLSEYIEGPHEKGSKYDLIGVDCHSGTMSGGHYFAYAKNWVTGDWCDFNDSSASIMKDTTRMFSSSAYLLFYRRQSAAPLGGPELQRIVAAYRQEEAPEPQQPEQPEQPESASSSPSTPGEDASDSNPLDIAFSQPSWTFNRPVSPDGSQSMTDNLFEDDDSNIAVGDNNSEPGDHLEELDSSVLASEGDVSFEDVPALLEDASSDELSVVELRVD